MPPTFTVRKQKPVLVAPARPTPHEFKTLSDIDSLRSLRCLIPNIHLYRNNPSMAGRDPARVLRDALAKALVFYYPLAGRLRESPSGKLAVDCNGEGALFVEADADIELRYFGSKPLPPFAFLEEFIYGVDSSYDGVLDCPLVTFQVTRLKCGGYVLGFLMHHSVVDAAGIGLFLNVVSEMAMGADSPSVPPVWARELLLARDPQAGSDEAVAPLPAAGEDRERVLRMFFFGPRELSALRLRLPLSLQKTATNFDVLAACLWRSHAVSGDLEGEVRLGFTVNRRREYGLPAGYYGNAFAPVFVRADADELRRRPLGYAVEMVRVAKASVAAGDECITRLFTEFLALGSRPNDRVFTVSDASRLWPGMDCGWGEAVYAGPAVGGGRVPPRRRSFLLKFTNTRGEDGVVVPVGLPAPTMERFAMEIERMVKEPIVSPL